MGAFFTRIAGIILNFFKSSSLSIILFLKVFIMSFMLYVFPDILVWSFIQIKKVILPFVFDLISPYIDNILISPITLNITGIGGWLIDNMKLVQCITVLMSAFITSFIFRFIFK
jgi:hypothetical protein